MRNIPIYVTRKNASGETGEFSLAPWPFLITCAMVWFNVMGWSAYGLYTLGDKIL